PSEIQNTPFFIFPIILIIIPPFTKSPHFPFYISLPHPIQPPTPLTPYLHSPTILKPPLYLIPPITPIFPPSQPS
ncbi:hypothetical protein, partial [Staphylococcus aureus]|uniref:hypothetical protein n=1 Tax=Staphylococcus aureus TaxID=1280 RepID=UPI0021B2DCC5